MKLKWWDSMVLERMSRRGKQIFVVSELTRAEVKHLFGYDSITLGNPLDVSDFRPLNQLECRQKLGLPREGVIGVLVGNTNPTKNFPMVQKLIVALPEIHWVLALRGVPENWKAPGGNARAMRNVPRDLITELYSAADFSICPSRYDAFPHAVPEALACGLPVLSGVNGGSLQFLREPPLDRLVIQDPDNANGYVAAAKDLVPQLEF